MIEYFYYFVIICIQLVILMNQYHYIIALKKENRDLKREIFRFDYHK